MTAPDLRLILPAKAENVGVVRHALAGLAEALGMEPGPLGDLKTVVTEACMNTVVHAYGDGAGSMEIDAVREDDALVVVVRDHGSGIRPKVDIDRESLRMGLPLIAALSSSFEISGGPGNGHRRDHADASVGERQRRRAPTRDRVPSRARRCRCRPRAWSARSSRG